ncbi:hypothetical protein CNBC6970 [Cryptococcus deneoformans B-3501A]|uniref:PHD-type domain-containing protein n=1 Tax=Cryptococcus deneoformans (strain JEC21 / ATCC MYA-565) TaxID=214684 RepID=Q5KL97_CRYD1|nr:conserved hypothetical protein [Cryptococcus neoformans var. neoformans JEC21]XP_776308.1 hypothetical protein CNBC6970 [Cryptococcus neoformans var. neoformans B-3501A]AAW42093.1 conserved hypothetical protein [Cryptococcus neoformans var. neoformans JEC21]EAL21661.1 hypothetical protein CNBC6970 [Cryptococcus neoformans var. neoformans B-3501A]
MPRKALPPVAVAPVDALRPPPPPSPIVQTLRKDWRWAAISQFIATFSDAFGLLDWDIEVLEKDFDGDETALIPTLVAKLLFALTYNRQINSENAFEQLRKQYLKRAPETTLLGTVEEPVEWAALGLSQKVGILHQLCEWQMDDPARFRGLLKTEDDAVSWRIEPVGWDKSGNIYWLFDDNRLWIQRTPPLPPAPPKKSSLKAKRALKRARNNINNTSKSNSKFKAKPAPKPKPKTKPSTSTPRPKGPPVKREPTPPPEEISGSRRRAPVAFYGNPTPTALALKRGAVFPPASGGTPTNGRATRSSARISGVNGNSTDQSTAIGATPSKTAKKTQLPLGTRVSRRLRNVDDEWQQVPDEWLDGAKEDHADTEDASDGEKEEEGDDDESELSDLTDEEEHAAEVEAVKARESQENGQPKKNRRKAVKEEVEEKVEEVADADSPLSELPEPDPEPIVEQDDEEDEYNPDEDVEQDDAMDVDETEPKQEEEEDDAEEDGEEEEDIIKAAIKEANNLPEGFIEWETVCVTLYDWRTFPEQFAKSKHPDEKALYKLLHDQVGPTIIEQLTEKEKERLKQEAFLNRKRSSRIATKELEKEEAVRREQAQREMEERMERTRKEEMRKAKEEAEALAREKAREDRLKEREERAQAREEAALRKAEEEQKAKEKEERRREKRKRRREGEIVSDDSEDESSQAPSRRSRTMTPSHMGETTNQKSKVGAGKAVAGNRWELGCEVCGMHGWNIDGDKDLVSCDECGKWQHVECLDRLDRSQGRVRRNWSKVDFTCKECQQRAANKRLRIESLTHANSRPIPVIPSPLAPRPTPPHPYPHPRPHSAHQQQQSPPYPILPGSAPGPQPLLNPSRPPPPPLQAGQYYLPYPPESRSPAQPAGYAVYYPPGDPRHDTTAPQPHHQHQPHQERRISGQGNNRRASAEGYAPSPTGVTPGYASPHVQAHAYPTAPQYSSLAPSPSSGAAYPPTAYSHPQIQTQAPRPIQVHQAHLMPSHLPTTARYPHQPQMQAGAVGHVPPDPRLQDTRQQ